MARQDTSRDARQRSSRRMERAAEGIVRDAARRIGRLEQVRSAVAGWRARVRANAAGRITLKVVAAMLGVTTVLIGIVLIPLPGPGWLIVFMGLAILSVEFVWARHLLRYGREKLKIWTWWVGRQSWLMRLAIGSLGMIFIAAVFWLTVRNSFGVDLAQAIWSFLTSA